MDIKKKNKILTIDGFFENSLKLLDNDQIL